MAIEWMPVGSSAIDSIGYDNDADDLWVVFRGRRGAPTYRYPNVDKELFDDWLKASSKGAFFHANVKHLGSSSFRSPFQAFFLRPSAGLF